MLIWFVNLVFNILSQRWIQLHIMKLACETRVLVTAEETVNVSVPLWLLMPRPATKLEHVCPGEHHRCAVRLQTCLKQLKLSGCNEACGKRRENTELMECMCSLFTALFCDYYNPPGECEWHYNPCGAPCMKTCRNPSGTCSSQIPPIEGTERAHECRP